MPNSGPPIHPDEWKNVEDLFQRLMDATDPQKVLEREPDRAIAEAARRLWENDTLAGGESFLEKTLTFVRELAKPEPPCFEPGQVLAGRFRVVRLLGSGGMGDVYLADDSRLSEQVALKSIRPHLAGDPAIRRRFVAEVQNARRVTHPHLCRIYELFDEGETSFFTMQYLEGCSLTEWLKRPHKARTRQRIALELAEALAEAHRIGVLHCDFKPANVILTGREEDPAAYITDFGLARAFAEPLGGIAANSLQGGTSGYMAPELLRGERPTVQSDIFAYGRVLAELLPGQRMAARCQAPVAEDRPASLAPVIRDLEGAVSRRWWLGGGVAAAAAALAFELRRRPHLVVAGRQRVVLNGFRPAEAGSGQLLRNLLVTALRQSPLITVVADDRLGALLQALQLPRTLPADHARLLDAAAKEAALLIEGTVEAAGRGLRLLVQVFEPGKVEPALAFAEITEDARQIIRLADRTGLRLRREFGESAASLSHGHTSLEQVTSASPEAVDLYFRGVREYESARTEPAVALLDQAIALDSQFALAHLHRGIALLAHYQFATAISSYESAFALRKRLTERERLSVESRYYIFITDFDSSIKVSRRLLTLFPEEPAFQRAAAFALVRLGRPKDALPYNQRALDLDPGSENNISEWMVNHCAALLPDEALALLRSYREQGNQSSMLDYGAANAWLVKEDYENARLAFERLGASPERDRWSRLLRCGPLMMQGRFAEAATHLRSDLAYDLATGEQGHQQNRRVWLGMSEWLMNEPSKAREQAVALTSLDPLPVWLQTLREGAMLADFLGEPALLAAALDRVREIERRWPSTHSHGARAHLEGILWSKQDSGRAGELLNEARGLWPDCLTLYSAAQWHMGQKDFEQAAAALDTFEEQRGVTLRLFFPPLITLGRIQRARCFAGMSQNSDALRLYSWVLALWGKTAGLSLDQAGSRRIPEANFNSEERCITMIDAWEIFGRMLTDDDFRASVYRAAPKKHPAINKATRAEFAERDFTRMRDAVTAVIQDRPISLSGLGEILWPMVNNTRAFRLAISKLARIIKQSGANTDSDDPYFYVALGAMVVDPNLRSILDSDPPYTFFDDFGFTSLSEDDRAALVAIFTFDPDPTSTEAPGDSASNDICDTEWGSDCFLRTVWWEYPPLPVRGTKRTIPHPHSHPVPLMTPPRASRKK